jgi:hypothetical protein
LIKLSNELGNLSDEISLQLFDFENFILEFHLRLGIIILGVIFIFELGKVIELKSEQSFHCFYSQDVFLVQDYQLASKVTLQGVD